CRRRDPVHARVGQPDRADRQGHLRRGLQRWRRRRPRRRPAVGAGGDRLAMSGTGRAVLAIVALLVAAAAAPVAAAQSAVLRGLDKITARVTTFEAPLDATVKFGTLLITPRACHKR